MAKAASVALKAHLALEATTITRCWKIVRTDGTEFNFTTHDAPLIIGGRTYRSTTGFTATAVANKSDMSVDNLDVQGVFDDDTITLSDLRGGKFDYADVYIFVVNWADISQGILKMRRGKLGECVSSPQGWFKAELRGLTQLLQQRIGQLYGPSCRADLFDSRCGLNKDDYAQEGSVSSLNMDGTIQISEGGSSGPSVPSTPAPGGWYQYGTLLWTSGANDGTADEIKLYDGAGKLGFYIRPFYPMVGGDTFIIYPGCDKTIPACRDKFANLLRKRSEDYLPGNDQVFNYPDSKG